jgi:hypothetical protein
MDHKHKISLKIYAFLLSVLLSGCSEEINTGAKLEADNLFILGIPTDTLYYDKEIEIKFGATGGDGVYRYRYIQNPEPEDRDDDFVFNPLELEVENNDAGKPSFSLKGIISSGNGVDVEDLVTGTFTYQVGITDGNNEEDEKIQEFQYTLEVNKFRFAATTLSPEESVISISRAKVLLDIKNAGSNEVCDDVSTKAFEASTLPNGIKVYPYVFEVRLSAGVVEPLELFYRFKSGYDNELPERHKSNHGSARPNVDYLDEERSIIFKPGQIACVGYLNMLDDALVEGPEELTVEFYDKKGGAIILSSGESKINIRDNEPRPSYESKEVIRNEGEKVIGLISLAAPYKLPVSVQVSIDENNTTASPDDYFLEPSNGIVTILPGELEASFTVTLLSNDDGVDSGADDVITVVTGIDELLSVEPFKIHINEWPLSPEDEIVSQNIIAEQNENKREALTIDISSAGTVLILMQDESISNENQSVLIARQRDGASKKLVDTDLGEIVLTKQGVDVVPVKAGSFVYNDENYIGIVANVNGLYADVHRGEGDFIVALYKLDLAELSPTYGYYIYQYVNQYGSNGNDIAKGAVFDDRGAVYIFGKTNGSEFDGVPSIETNKGGEDGFVYKLNLFSDSDRIAWKNGPRFIGTSDLDLIAGLDAGRSDLVVLVETENTDKDLFVFNISASTGSDIEGVPRGNISSTFNETSEGVKLNSTDGNSYILADSQSILPDGNPSPTLSRDINVLQYNSQGIVTSFKVISTGSSDFSTDIEALPENNAIAVSGYTDGEFEENQRKSTDGTDAFISVSYLGSSDFSVADKIIQFGTKGNDKVIDIESASDNKILVLWSEDYTSQNGALTYRVSAFSSTGEMLSAEP